MESANRATFVGAEELLPAEPSADQPKRNLLAALVSLIVPGLGHIYIGLSRKGVVLMALLTAVLVGFWPLRLLHSYHGFCLLYGGWVCMYVYAPSGALIARGAYGTKPASKWWLIAFLPLSLITAELLGIGVTRASGFRSFEVPSISMDRTIQNGDLIVADLWYYRSRTPERDEVIIFKRNDTFFVKRVIAVGGDIIAGRDGLVLLNGQTLDEPFVEHQESYPTSASSTFGPVTVPRDKFFVMGDNRDESLDSRYPSFGLVDKNSIQGKTMYIFASGRQGKKIQ